MANQDHTTILQKGVPIWNDWRVSSAFEKPDLSGINLSDKILCGINFANTDLRKANLDRSILTNSDLGDVILVGGSMRSAELSRADLSRAKLDQVDARKANLSQANLTGASVIDANFAQADLRDADLMYTDFSKSLLYKSRLHRVRALSTNFRGANLTGISILDWSINGLTDLEDVTCEYIFKGDIGSDRRPCNLNRKFRLGEFAGLIQVLEKAFDIIDITFTNDIDFKSFFYSLEELRKKYQSSDISLKSFEKGNGVFNAKLSLNIGDIDLEPEKLKSEIASLIEELYTQKSFAESQRSLIEKGQGKIEALEGAIKAITTNGIHNQTFHLNGDNNSIVGMNHGLVKIN